MRNGFMFAGCDHMINSIQLICLLRTWFASIRGAMDQRAALFTSFLRYDSSEMFHKLLGAHRLTLGMPL